MYKKKTVLIFTVTLLMASLIVFLLSFATIINIGGSTGLYSKISSQILAQRYSAILLLSLFLSISSLIVSFLIWLSDRKFFLVNVTRPLIGYIIYIAILALYFYDQILNQSNLINILLNPAGIQFPAGHLGLWSNRDLFTTRIIQTLITGLLVYYGFFSAILFSESKKPFSMEIILYITVSLLSLLFVVNKLLGVRLHDVIPGAILHMSLLFLFPFISLLMIFKVFNKNYLSD